RRSLSLLSALKKKVDRTAAEKKVRDKVVHFADSIGMDLVQVKCIFPYSSSEDFRSSIHSFSVKPSPLIKASLNRVTPHSGTFNDTRFIQLLTSATNMQKDYDQVSKERIQRAITNGICLKSVNVIGMTLSAIVTVYNYSYQKDVIVRYTLDGWRSYNDIATQYVTSNAQENTDSFSFTLFLPHSMPVGAKCEFALRCSSAGKEYWDNNRGSNYVLECKTMADHYRTSAHLSKEAPVFY
ncbi:hypothetical protein PMAYCL1PPCAC_15814, partial [Pristionchus mayeri]